MEGDLGFSHAPEAELKDRKILKICRKKEEEETKKRTEERAVAAVEAEVAGCGFERAHETELSERKILKIKRKTEEARGISRVLRSLLPLRLRLRRRRQKKICERRKKGDATGLMAGLGNGKVTTI